jgi:hypothetical protein
MQRQDPTSRFDPTSGDRVTELETLVLRKLAGQVRDFRVVAKNQGLVLLGITRSYHAKQLAQHAIMEATEQPIIANEIEVVSTDLLDRHSQFSVPANEEHP